MKLAYLACPYTDDNPTVRESRHTIANDYAARLTSIAAIFSPITHGPMLEQYLKPSISKSHKFWMDQCIPLLRVSTDLYVLPLKGWRMSKGVQIEMDLARQLLIPIIIIQSEEKELELVSTEEADAMGWRLHWAGRLKVAKAATGPMPTELKFYGKVS